MSEELQFAVLHEFVAPAKRNLSRDTWDYLMGAAETETTHARNRSALDALAFRPRVLRNVETIDTSATLFGRRVELPVILAPIGSLQDLVAGGGTVPTRVAERANVLHMLSSVCAPGLEAVAAVNDYPKIFQLYVRGDAAWVDAYVERVVAERYIAVALTVDLDYYGRRERDLAKRYRSTARRTASADHFQARFCWADVARLRRKFDIPIILKGIATAEDAKLAVEHGVAGVYVSNHGGRQLDHGLGAVAVLPEVFDAVRGRATIIVDGGFMRGTDVVKAKALGADAVGLGRLQGLALAAGGEAALLRMLALLRDEVTRCLGLLGVRSFAELDRSYLAPAPPTTRSGLDSAFPLLAEGY
jgi:isopentenyl diphosphate isomerase/L-lactate dehydrogenase-like FMN-dependent dehydrogenase